MVVPLGAAWWPVPRVAVPVSWVALPVGPSLAAPLGAAQTSEVRSPPAAVAARSVAVSWVALPVAVTPPVAVAVSSVAPQGVPLWAAP